MLLNPWEGGIHLSIEFIRFLGWVDRKGAPNHSEFEETRNKTLKSKFPVFSPQFSQAGLNKSRNGDKLEGVRARYPEG